MLNLLQNEVLIDIFINRKLLRVKVCFFCFFDYFYKGILYRFLYYCLLAFLLFFILKTFINLFTIKAQT